MNQAFVRIVASNKKTRQSEIVQIKRTNNFFVYMKGEGVDWGDRILEVDFVIRWKIEKLVPSSL